MGVRISIIGVVALLLLSAIAPALLHAQTEEKLLDDINQLSETERQTRRRQRFGAGHPARPTKAASALRPIVDHATGRRRRIFLAD